MDRLRPLYVLSLVLALGLAALPVTAGNDAWSVDGSPAGGGVWNLVVDPVTPSTLYVVSSPGIFESKDAGADWSLTLPLPDNNASDIVVEPENHTTAYVATQGEGIFKTTDAGSTWTAVNNGIGTIFSGTEEDSVYLVAVDPVNAGTAYAVTLNTGVFKTVDGGAHWSAVNTGLTTTIKAQGFLNSFAVDPKNPQVLYLTADVLVNPSQGGAYADDPLTGLYQSVDGGAHWTQLLTYQPFSSVTVDPNNDKNVYAGGGTALYVSTDGGTTWALDSVPVESILAIDPSNSLNMWGDTASGLDVSTDGGTTWTASSLTPGITANSLVVDPVTPANIYIASGWGVSKSTDGGATWNQSSTGIHNVVVNQMFEGPDGVIYLASAGNGIYTSPDQGVTWSEVGSGVTGSLPLRGDFVYALVQDPKATSTLYAGSTEGLYKSTDGGNTWVESDTGMVPNVYILALAIDPEAPGTLYAATNTGSGTGLYKSVDYGAHWTSAATGITVSPYGGLQALAVDPHHSNVVYAGAYATGLYKSTDGGTSWQSDNGSFGATDVWAIAVDPTDSSIVYVATTKGFFKSTDAGATWAESDKGLNYNYILTDIQIDPANTTNLYVSQRYGIGDAYMSTDGGATWNPMTTGLTTSSSLSRHTESFTSGGTGSVTESTSSKPITVTAVAIDPRKTTQILAAGSDGQIYTYDNLSSGTGGGGSGGGGSGGGPGGGSGNGSPTSGGGGAFPLIPAFLLFGLAALRRRYRHA